MKTLFKKLLIAFKKKNPVLKLELNLYNDNLNKLHFKDGQIMFVPQQNTINEALNYLYCKKNE